MKNTKFLVALAVGMLVAGCAENVPNAGPAECGEPRPMVCAALEQEGDRPCDPGEACRAVLTRLCDADFVSYCRLAPNCDAEPLCGPDERGSGAACGDGGELCRAVTECGSTLYCRPRAGVADAEPVPDSGPPLDAGLPDASDPADGRVRDAAPPDDPPNLSVALYINVGDSISAGYNARGRNGQGGQGYSRLLQNDLGGAYRDLGDSGADSADALATLRGALGNLPESVEGDVVVTIVCGGNDFNDDIAQMVLRSETERVGRQLQDNYREMARLVRTRYEVNGHRVILMFTNVHDPTGATGEIPNGFDDGFCGLIQNPRFGLVAGVVLANLDRFNEMIAEVVTELDGVLVDTHALFLDHGMNADDRWIADDCAHFNDRGHTELKNAFSGRL